MSKPLAVLIYMEGCDACDEAKPEFHKLARQYPQLQCAMMDIDKAKLKFPVEYTPTLALKMPRGIYKADGSTIGVMTADNMAAWLGKAVQDYRSRGL